jgi:hypothetical protein
MAHRIIRSLFICLLVMSMASCAHTPASPFRIDGSTPESFDATWKRMYDNVRPEEQSQLSAAVIPIALGQHKSFADMPNSKGMTIGPQDIRTLVNGMTFQEILTLARKQPFSYRIGI